MTEVAPELGPVGQRVVLENDVARVWEIALEPGESQPLHRHDHPYLVLALEAADNRIETIGGEVREVHEPVGGVVFREGGDTHSLENVGGTSYRSRLVEFRTLRPTDSTAAQALAEVLIDTSSLAWAEKSLAGLSHKMLWRDERTEASIALVKFEAGAGIPTAHVHAANQFMYCLSGRYEYTETGLLLAPGSFYWNPRGSVHGPTSAHETSILLEIYDGPHYPVRPSFYTNDEDAR